VLWVTLADGIDGFHALDNLAEDRMLAIEAARRCVGMEG
jgi:hypothetical protein